MNAADRLHEQIAAVLAEESGAAPEGSGAETGATAALHRLIPLVYGQLREMAHRQLAAEHGTRTIQTTGLVHEAYLKVAASSDVTTRGKSYFFAAASRAMRQVLVDRARRRNAVRRGGGADIVSLDDDAGIASVDAFATDVLDLDEALDRLADRNDRHARVVECRFFGGLTVEETAAALGVSPRTVKHDWLLARAWLYDALHGPNEPDPRAKSGSP